MTTTTNIDLSVFHKKRFTIDGDSSKILELDTSDLSVLTRLSETYPKLEELGTSATQIQPTASGEYTDEDILKVGHELADIDKKMRQYIDYIFDSNVCEMCAPHGSMYDPIKGKLRYERLIEIIVSLYESNLSKELKRLEDRVKTHTDKYTK